MTETSDKRQLAEERRVVDTVPTELLIDGEWRPAASGRTLEVEDPATGETLVEVADGDDTDALAALDAADRAQPAWAATPPRERGEILRRAFETLTANAGDLALLMTLEMGKPLAESRAEITYAAEFFRWYSEEAVRITGDYRVAPAGGSRLIVHAPARGPGPVHHARGTSRWPWARARSARPSPPAAPWSSSRPPSLPSRRWRWPRF